MKAIVYERYGAPDVLQIQEVQTPTPKANQILVQVRATTVTAADWRMRKAEPFPARLYNGLFRPKRFNILGMELAGDVVAVGQDVTRFKVGDAVFGSAELTFGAYAEYICLPENGVVAQKPENISYEEAAASAFGGLGALHYFLHKAKLQPGQKTLVYGASGATGTYAVQLARYYGAQVTGVCSESNFELVKSLGAEQVIDYTKEDFTTREERYDFIFDAVGKTSPSASRKVLAPGGIFATIVKGGGSTKERANDFLFLRDRLAAGDVRAVIDRQYPMEQIVEAHRYVDQGHKKGNVVILIGEAE
ncbi:MAG TPA: NAD(P)-dependent alcohol dehydrogenase [Anaerolineales bacterium]|nr:NAD(P)-dependent alcohol dehydrogenase [Anaerolineales bacterium]